MTNKVYTPALRQALFRSLVTHIGPWNPTWGGGRSQDVNTNEWNQICELVRKDLFEKYGDAAPKTARSIAMAIYFCISENVEPGTKDQGWLRDAAYLAGFLQLNDILKLEDLYNAQKAK